jgi:Rrf2 family protein
MQVSRELDYGMRAMVVLAAHESEILSKRRVASEFRIPVNFLALILPKLVHRGLIESLPGPQGGYRLARPAVTISLYDVAEAVDESFSFNRCRDPERGCDETLTCPITDVWKQLHEQTVAMLREITLKGLATQFVTTSSSSGQA